MKTCSSPKEARIVSASVLESKHSRLLRLGCDINSVGLGSRCHWHVNFINFIIIGKHLVASGVMYVIHKCLHKISHLQVIGSSIRFISEERMAPYIISHILWYSLIGWIILLPPEVVLWLVTKILFPAEVVLFSQSEYQRMREMVSFWWTSLIESLFKAALLLLLLTEACMVSGWTKMCTTAGRTRAKHSPTNLWHRPKISPSKSSKYGSYRNGIVFVDNWPDNVATVLLCFHEIFLFSRIYSDSRCSINNDLGHEMRASKFTY